jgi:hypothetical protein
MRLRDVWARGWVPRPPSKQYSSKVDETLEVVCEKEEEEDLKTHTHTHRQAKRGQGATF